MFLKKLFALLNYFGFGQSAVIDIVFDGAENRATTLGITADGKIAKQLVYNDDESVSGKVNVTLRKSGKCEHHGIKIELIGQIEFYHEPRNNFKFTSSVSELAGPGYLTQNASYPFEFADVEKPSEAYVDSNVRVRYFLRVAIVRRFSDIVREIDFTVHKPSNPQSISNKGDIIEFALGDSLHVKFEYNKSQFELIDEIVGKITVPKDELKIKRIEVLIRKRKYTASGPKVFDKIRTVEQYTITDGVPVAGKTIPVHLSLSVITPSMGIVLNNRIIAVHYVLTLTVTDEDDRTFSGRQQINFLRKSYQSIGT